VTALVVLPKSRSGSSLVNLIRERIGAAGREEEASMDRSELLEVASQYLDRVIILLTVAGEERLALDIEEWMDGLDFSGLPLDAKPTPRIYH
jgi:hypothetical protein